MGQGYPGNGGFKKVGVYATKEELGTVGTKLETEHGRRHCTAGNKSLEWWICWIIRYGLETHAHQTVWRELRDFETRRICGCSAKRLTLRLRRDA